MKSRIGKTLTMTKCRFGWIVAILHSVVLDEMSKLKLCCIGLNVTMSKCRIGQNVVMYKVL